MSPINHSKSKYDILNHSPWDPFNETGVDDKGIPEQTFKKINGISEFTNTTQIASSKLNIDY